MNEYHQLVERYSAEISSLSRRYNVISYLRLTLGLMFIAGFYLLIRTGYTFWLGPLLLIAGAFIYLIRIHQKVSARRELATTLKSINQDEIDFLHGAEPYDNGVGFMNPQHSYSFDLDIFGPHSLYQFLNRTTTYLGSRLLADSLQVRLAKDQIIRNQEAVSELAGKLSLRQQIRALGLIHSEGEGLYRYLLEWSQHIGGLGRIPRMLIYVFPAFLFLFLIVFTITENGSWLNYATTVFIFNLILLGNFQRKIKAELSGLDRLDRMIKQYGMILSELETADFSSQELKYLKANISREGSSAGAHLKELAYLLNQLESVYNGMAALLFSGTISYHLHLLKKMYQWKNRHAPEIIQWLKVIAQFEMLSSYANFKYNNPDFAFPEICDDAQFIFKGLGHPLVNSSVRVTNDIDFNHHRFVILTGSNMSGKSTFLRSIGVNVILAGAGAPVCATSAKLYPFKVLVSMRVADSLAENESYFYAEVKRLKQITDELNTDHCLVLLDEILRGTNSDDKRNGTLEVIRRMVKENAYGIIATHDLEICKETDNHAGVLANKCFEVEIRDNELYFDYKLREGICINQSATFLMKKIGII